MSTYHIQGLHLDSPLENLKNNAFCKFHSINPGNWIFLGDVYSYRNETTPFAEWHPKKKNGVPHKHPLKRLYKFWTFSPIGVKETVWIYQIDVERHIWPIERKIYVAPDPKVDILESVT